MQMKPKNKRNSNQKPKEQEVLRRVFCNIEIMKELYTELHNINESLIDDLCYSTERIIELEERLKAERKRPTFDKGVIIGGLIVIILWTLSLI